MNDREIIFAAMDTAFSGLSRVFHVLASRPDVQEKMRTEILEATAHKENGHLDHDEVVELPYLDSVLRETLRLCVLLFSCARSAAEEFILY